MPQCFKCNFLHPEFLHFHSCSLILSLSVSLLLCPLHVKSAQIWLCGSDCHSFNELLCQTRGFGNICPPSASLAPHRSMRQWRGSLPRMLWQTFLLISSALSVFHACGIRLSRRGRVRLSFCGREDKNEADSCEYLGFCLMGLSELDIKATRQRELLLQLLQRCVL